MDATIPASKKYFTEDELVAMGVAEKRTLQTWRRLRRVLPFAKVGRTVRYPAHAVEKYLTENTVTVTA